MASGPIARRRSGTSRSDAAPRGPRLFRIGRTVWLPPDRSEARGKGVSDTPPDPLEVLLTGARRPPPDPVALRAGSVTLELDGADLRRIAYDDVEVATL